jgi:hypothetical protein
MYSSHPTRLEFAPLKFDLEILQPSKKKTYFKFREGRISDVPSFAWSELEREAYRQQPDVNYIQVLGKVDLP